jgi:ATP-dependent helicase/nuclease subunit A
MSKLRVISASAGSGKTYRITSEYLRLLFKNPKNYKHILAVTFTNKATEEMKTRILSELYSLANNEKSNQLEMLMKEFNLNEIETRKNARTILNTILHNYSRFSISTIDSFFQRIIKSFARETGLQFNFEVELDSSAVLEKASEQMLEKLRDDKTLLDWLVQFAEDRIEDGKKWDFKEEILKLGRELFNEQFNSFPASFHDKLKDREALKAFQKTLFNSSKVFENQMKEYGINGLKLISQHGLHVSDFKYGIRGSVGSYFTKLSKGNTDEPGSYVRNGYESIDNWLPKDKEIAQRLITLADAGLYTLLKNSMDYYNQNYPMYKSVAEVLKSFYTLGILSDLSTEMSLYATENNIFVLAQSGSFLKAIIDENDAPFIYEKTGQTYSHFMIDEFQDTSGVQWFNFKPLLNNSLSESHHCMVVGDVKQSIYRWRNSDWKIMSQQLSSDMAEHGLLHSNLEYNWRSKPNIIKFNNSFFETSSKFLQALLNDQIPEKFDKIETSTIENLITTAYENCTQQIPENKNSNTGFVQIQFLPNEKKDWNENVLQGIPEILNKIQDSGYSLNDIAILVRTASEGRSIIDFLNRYKELMPENHPYRYNVLSNESAFLKNASAIDFIIKLLKFTILPEDSVNAAALAYDYLSMTIPDAIQESDMNHLFSPLNVLPSDFIENIDNYKYLPTSELFEKIISIFKLHKNSSDLPFLQSFHDSITDFEAHNTSSIQAFLEHWEEKKSNLSVSVSDNQDAIRVMTIHKSKGLEFANVIIPYCNWSLDHAGLNAPTIWCSSDIEPFNQLEFLPLKYSQALSKSVFIHDYLLEKSQSFVDNLNLLYVAFTRAAHNLYAFAPVPGKAEKVNSVGNLLFAVLQLTSQLQNNQFPSLTLTEFWKNETQSFEVGSICKKENIHVSEIHEIPLNTYTSNDLKEKLKQRFNSQDFWNTDESEKSTGRNYGNLMHRLFQSIETLNDIEKAVDSLIFAGLLKNNERSDLIHEVTKKINEKPYSDWFNGSWKIINEAGIIIPKQAMQRPDRVMIKNNKTLVVDYKFGLKQRASYNSQVKRYMEYLNNMGYSNVEGLVWYVNLNLLDKVA